MNKFHSFQLGVLSSQWDRLLIQNWKGDIEFIKSLKRGEAFEEEKDKPKKGSRSSIRNSIANDSDQFFSFKEYAAKSKFSKNRRVSIMKQRLMPKDMQSKKFDNLIPSIMPHALEMNVGVYFVFSNF